MKFRLRNEHELSKLTDEELVEYIVDARNAGKARALPGAVGVFAYRRQNMVMARIALKNVPEKDREQIFMDVMAGTLAADLKAVSVGEIVNLIKTITKRRIADYFDKNRHELNQADPPDDGSNFYDDIPDGVDDIPGTELEMLISQLMDDEPARKQRAVQLRIQGYPSKQVAALINEEFPDDEEMSYMNVDQIFSRFKKSLRKVLDEAEGL